MYLISSQYLLKKLNSKEENEGFHFPFPPHVSHDSGPSSWSFSPPMACYPGSSLFLLILQGGNWNRGRRGWTQPPTSCNVPGSFCSRQELGLWS